MVQCRIDSGYYNREYFPTLFWDFTLEITSELTQLEVWNSAELNAKKYWEKTVEFIWSFWTAKIWNLRILPNWTQKSVEKKLLKLNSFGWTKRKNTSKNKISVPIRSTAPQQLLQAIWVLVLNLKFVLCQENLVNPKVLANLVPNCF